MKLSYNLSLFGALILVVDYFEWLFFGFISGRKAANRPNISPPEMADNQLLSRHHGRNDMLKETGVIASRRDVKTHTPKTNIAAIKPATKPLLKFG